MLTLEEIMRRFVIRRSTEPPTQVVEPMQPQPNQAPVVINGMGELLAYVADQTRHIEELEAELKQRRSTSPTSTP